MKTIKSFFEGINVFKNIANSNKKQLDEIKKLEQQIEKLQVTEKEDKKAFKITNRMMFKFWLFGGLAVFLGYLIFKTLDVLYLILTAYIVSIAMEAVIDRFEKLRLSRGLSITITYTLLILFLLSGFVFILPFMVNQLSEVVNILVIKINGLQQMVANQGLIGVFQNYLPNFLSKEVLHQFSDPQKITQIQTSLQQNLSQMVNLWTNYASSLGNFAVNFVTGFATFVTQSSIVIVLAILFSVEKRAVMSFVASLGGQKKYKYIYMKLEKIYKKLGIWLKSRLILSLYIAITMYVALWIMSVFGMDIDNKLSIAVILGLLDIIPYLGPTVGGIPAALSAGLSFGIWGVVIVSMVVFLVNFIQNNVLAPVLMNKTLGINTIVIFISMIIGGLVMGVVGILLAVPIAAIVTLLFEKELE